MPTVFERIRRGEVIVLDGAMGTELQRRGVPMDRVAWSAAALATHGEVIRQIHEDYSEAGADILITNSFGASRHVLEPVPGHECHEDARDREQQEQRRGEERTQLCGRTRHGRPTLR